MSDNFRMVEIYRSVVGNYAELQTIELHYFIFVGCILLRYNIALSKYTCNRN
jgi:hypothetical protein